MSNILLDLVYTCALVVLFAVPTGLSSRTGLKEDGVALVLYYTMESSVKSFISSSYDKDLSAQEQNYSLFSEIIGLIWFGSSICN